MNAENEFESVLGQINEELSSVPKVYRDSRLGHGADVITGPELIPGWIGIIYADGRQSFGPASEILVMVQSYVRKRLEKKSLPVPR
jgi:hypothetical protein